MKDKLLETLKIDLHAVNVFNLRIEVIHEFDPKNHYVHYKTILLSIVHFK